MNRIICTAVALAISVVVSCQSARATLVGFSDAAAYQAALGGNAEDVIGFDTFGSGAILSTQFGLTFSGLVESTDTNVITSVTLVGSGAGYHFDNLTTSTSATAVPEPSSLALTGMILAGVGMTRRRRVPS